MGGKQLTEISKETKRTWINQLLGEASEGIDDSLWESACNSGAITIHELNYYKMEKFGGGCPKCKKAWRLMTFENQFGKIEYYQPTCTCIPRCNICNSLLYAELLGAMPGCKRCLYSAKNEEWNLPQCRQYTRIPRVINGRAVKNKFDKKRCSGELMLFKDGNFVCDECGKIYRKLD